MVEKGFGMSVLSQEFARQNLLASPLIPIIETSFCIAAFNAPGLLFLGGPFGPSCVMATILFFVLKIDKSFFKTDSHPRVEDPFISLNPQDSRTLAKI